MPVHPDTRIGHVHLKVADIDRSLKFYRDLLGFEVTQRIGDQAVFLSAGDYHHHIGLNTWESKESTPSPSGHTGLYHAAILFPNRYELARTLKKLIDAEYPLQGAANHGVSEAIYLADPDGNGVEISADKPMNEWPRTADGKLDMVTFSLDIEELLEELRLQYVGRERLSQHDNRGIGQCGAWHFSLA